MADTTALERVRGKPFSEQRDDKQDSFCDLLSDLNLPPSPVTTPKASARGGPTPPRIKEIMSLKDFAFSRPKSTPPPTAPNSTPQDEVAS
eukprot:CAMPEP_0173383902 /NCGR_PEP_ID=MMETSP1356-20130122/6472_1 /TAXON_ID=77927 ORGANISM="Hemiselmis virescens, Strain PCC157" /NCGR_SAMPLE_ID=MMETSP1356 /ASSEMBLY_ACC=CAM_ASM_000847 /LENGTH=89 /DNA_ID=CAMNT_0014338983 /DNA_START=103 /DNA_END=369 /DNA_ORIENTATION=-